MKLLVSRKSSGMAKSIATSSSPQWSVPTLEMTSSALEILRCRATMGFKKTSHMVTTSPVCMGMFGELEEEDVMFIVVHASKINLA